MASELKKTSSADKISSPVTAKPTNSDSGGDMQDIQAGVDHYDEFDDSKSNFQVPKKWKQNVDLLGQLDKRSVGKEVSRKDTVTAKPASSDSSGDTEDTKVKVVDSHGDDSKSNFQVSEIWKQNDLLDQLDGRSASKEHSEKDTDSNDNDSHHSSKSEPDEDEECFDENFDDDFNDDYDVTDDDDSDNDDSYDSHSEMFDDSYSHEFWCDLRYYILAHFNDHFDEDDDDFDNMSVDDGIDDDESDCPEGEEDIGTDVSINYESESGYSNEEDFMYDNYENSIEAETVNINKGGDYNFKVITSRGDTTITVANPVLMNTRPIKKNQ